MKTKNFKLREDQIEKLKNRYETTGIRMSETVRKAIDLYFEELEKKCPEQSMKSSK